MDKEEKKFICRWFEKIIELEYGEDYKDSIDMFVLDRIKEKLLGEEQNNVGI